ncbi:MAG: redoxin domain-containing protein [Acidobacteria bacterium]|nr:redoxin domain-containing protein [Acidobacteriota bacterium]
MTGVEPAYVLFAFLGGLLSFLSPCVLPLVPGYISLMSGVSVDQLREGGPGRMRTVLLHAVLFVLGLSVVFVAMGASASTVGQFLREHQTLLVRIAGVLIILLGIFLLGVFKVSALYRDARYHGALRPGKAGAFFLGAAFAFGWTPCIGPILAGVLLLAATKETVTQGVALLSVYSLGLGVPFLLTAVGINAFLSWYQGFRRYLNWVERVAGVLLIFVGVLLVANQFTRLAGYFAFMNRFNPEVLLEGSNPIKAGAAEFEPVPAPDPVMQRADGSAFRLSELRGKVVVVNFWATWCLPCRLEIPYFNRVAAEFKDRGVEFVGVSTDEAGWKAIEEFEREIPIEYPVVLDNEGEADKAFGPLQGLPVTVFIDRRGRIVQQSIGITDIDTLRENIEAALKEGQ